MSYTQLLEELKSGETIAFLNIGVFAGTTATDGTTIPHDSDSMILALNQGRAMSERLMYEYSRAAMAIEERRGRTYIDQIVPFIYSKEYARPAIYEVLGKLMPHFVIDLNRDTSLQKLYAHTPNNLLLGTARIGAEYDRFVCFAYDGTSYTKVAKEALDTSLPTLFQPMGSIAPEQSLVISDADYVDWLTEAFGGFAMPPYLKEYRKGRKFLLLGHQFNRDTDRMVAGELMLGSAGGYLVSDKELGKNEVKFIKKNNIEVINANLMEFVESLLKEVGEG